MFYNLDSIGKTAYICTVILKAAVDYLLKTEEWSFVKSPIFLCPYLMSTNLHFGQYKNRTVCLLCQSVY